MENKGSTTVFKWHIVGNMKIKICSYIRILLKRGVEDDIPS